MRLEAVLNWTKSVRVRDLTPERVETFLLDLEKPRKDAEGNLIEGPGARMLNTYSFPTTWEKDREIARLQRKIGELTMDNEILKKTEELA